MAECWSCGAERGDASFCTSCGKIQAAGDKTYFQILGLPRSMKLERADIERAYRESSMKVHPDRFGHESAVERRLALEHTTLVNDAYRALRDPQKRAEYLMSLEGVDIGKEESRTKNIALLSEMLELQEWIELEKSDDKLEKQRQEIAARVSKLLERVTSYFDAHSGTKERTVEALNELRYLKRLLERIDAKLDEV